MPQIHYDMNVIEVTNHADPRLDIYRSLTDSQFRRHAEAEHGIFIAESPKVISAAIECGYRPLSLLCENKHIDGDAAGIIAAMEEEAPVYTGSREVLSELTGYTLTRGVLCAMARKPVATVSEIIEGKRLVAVLDGVCDTTNIGSIFRSAAALGIDAVLLTPGTCDPLNRRSIRVSMGTVFRVPWTWIDTPLDSLHEFGFTLLAMALKSDSVPLNAIQSDETSRYAIVLGTEGDGLSDNSIACCDKKVIIPMHYGVDSLNVATAAAIAFWHLKN